MRQQIVSPRVPDRSRRGFTIVELLIVVVVIAILAAITIVAYNGISRQAKASAASFAAQQAAKKVMVYMTTNADQVPADLAIAGVTDSGGTTYQYRTDTSSSPQSFCVTATSNGISYFANNTTQTSPKAGACPGHGADGAATITNIAPDPAGTGSLWTGWAGQGGAGNITHLTGSGTTPSTYTRLTVTTTGTNSSGIIAGSWTPIPVTAGETYSFRISGRTSRSSGVNTYLLEVKWMGTSGQIGATVQTSTGFLGANVWHHMSRSGLTAPAGTTRVAVTAVAALSSGNAVGDTFDATGLMVERGGIAHSYADGNSPGWAWNGNPNGSTSTGPGM